MTILFVLAGLLCVAGALGVVLAKQAVHQVLFTVINFVGLAVLYLSLNAEFMAVIQIIIYGGAVMVLFLFVITLMTARKEPVEREVNYLSGGRLAGYSMGGGILLMLALVGVVGVNGGGPAARIDTATFGSVGAFGMELLTTHLLAFELTAFVLMVAVIGVVILVGRQQG